MSDQSFIQKAIKPVFHQKLLSWLSNCNKNQQKGIKIIESVIKNKGTKVFRQQSPKRNTKSANALRKPITSTYQKEYSNHNQRENIFNYRQLADLPCSQVLLPVAVKYLDNWIQKHDSEEYQKLVLEVLRAMTAVVNTQQSKFTTEAHKRYQWNDPSRNFTPHKITQGSKFPVRVTNPQKAQTRPASKQPEEIRMTPTLFTKQDEKKRILALSGDSGIFRSVGAKVSSFSEYKRTFVTHFNKYTNPSHPDPFTSISLGRLCPDPASIKK